MLDDLEINYREHRDGCLSRIAFALGQFYSLRYFSLSCDVLSISERREASCELIEVGWSCWVR